MSQPTKRNGNIFKELAVPVSSDFDEYVPFWKTMYPDSRGRSAGLSGYDSVDGMLSGSR